MHVGHLQIDIERVPIFMKMGHFAHERTAPQEVLVSISARLRQTPLDGISDDLSATVDYGEIIAKVEEVLQGAEFKLLERAVTAVAHACMDSFPRLESISVSAEKTFLPQRITKGAGVRVSHTLSRTAESQP